MNLSIPSSSYELTLFENYLSSGKFQNANCCTLKINLPGAKFYTSQYIWYLILPDWSSGNLCNKVFFPIFFFPGELSRVSLVYNNTTTQSGLNLFSWSILNCGVVVKSTCSGNRQAVLSQTKARAFIIYVTLGKLFGPVAT